MPKANSKLKALRLEAKLSQNHLARLADLDRSTVSAAERGREVTDITLEKLVHALSDALHKPLIKDDIIFVDQPRGIGSQSISIPPYVIERIKKRIADIGLTMNDLSQRTGLSNATLSNFLRSKSNISARRSTVQEIARALDFTWNQLMSPDSSVAPKIPAQTRSVHFTIRDGLIATIPTQDVGLDENDYRRLAALQNPLLQASKKSHADLSKNNKPFASLLDATENYLGELQKDVAEINYAVLYASGLQLAVAYESAEELIEKGELPDFDLDVLTSTRSVLQLHGPFILSSKDGRDLVTDAERYERNPTEERRFQADVKEFGEILRERDDLVEEKAGEFISHITAPDDGSEQFERRYLFTKGAAKNLVIVFSAGALVASTAFIPAVGPVVAASLGLLTVEAMKKSKPFNDLSGPIRKGLDDLSDIDLERLKKIPHEQLEKMREFVINNQDILRRVGGSAREMQWFRDVLEWVSASEAKPQVEQIPVLPQISQHVIIVGTRGSGKTETGKLLAQRLNVKFETLEADWDPTDANFTSIDNSLNAPPHVIVVSVSSYENSQFWTRASKKAKFVLLDNTSEASRYDRNQEKLRSSLSREHVFLRVETNGRNQVEETVERIMSKLMLDYLM